MVDAYVQVATDGPGKKVATSELTRQDGTVVEIQHVVIADPTDPNVKFSLGSSGVVKTQETDETQLLEQKKQTSLLRIIVLQLASLTGVPATYEDLME